MSYSQKMLIPLALGAAAAACNWLAMRGETRPVRFITVNRAMSPGEILQETDLQVLELPACYTELQDVAILHEHRAMLLGQPVVRTLAPSDILFWRDTVHHGPEPALRAGESEYAISLDGADVPADVTLGDEVTFRFLDGKQSNEVVTVGRFRVVSVGVVTAERDRSSRGKSHRVLGIALPDESAAASAQIQQLQALCDRRTLNDARLVRLVLHPRAS